VNTVGPSASWGHSAAGRKPSRTWMEPNPGVGCSCCRAWNILEAPGECPRLKGETSDSKGASLQGLNVSCVVGEKLGEKEVSKH
jgi:hypothetical protein